METHYQIVNMNITTDFTDSTNNSAYPASSMIRSIRAIRGQKSPIRTMKKITKLSLSLLTLTLTVNAETITVESDLNVDGTLRIKNSTIELTDSENTQSVDLSVLTTKDYVDEQISSVISELTLLDSSSWTLGSGSINKFNQIGVTAENERVIGINPFGEQTILWESKPNETPGEDGGWTASFDITPDKMHRFSVWLKKTNSNDGRIYFGTTRVNSDNTDEAVLSLEDTVVENPYFWAGNLPVLDKWYLLVGYVHGSNDPSTVNYGKMYDGETGETIAEFTDFKFQATNTKAGHRVFLYGDSNTSNRQYFYDPRVDIVNGREPSIAALLRKYDSIIINAVTADTISANEIQVSKNAVFEKSILLGTNDAVALNEDTAIVTGSYLGSVNPWGKLYLQNPIVNNYLASADKKFFVEFTGNLGNPDLGELFDGKIHQYEHNLLNPGETVTIKIDFTKSISHIPYTRGSLFISSHFKSKFEVTGARIINRDDRITAIPASGINVAKAQVHEKGIWEIKIPYNDSLLRAKSIEIDLLGANSTTATPIAEIEYFLRSPSTPEVSGSLVTKYHPETLYETLSFKNAAGDETIALGAETGDIDVGGMLFMNSHDGANASEGAIRFGEDGSGSNDFLGYVDGMWKSLTQSGGGGSGTDQTLSISDNQLTISGAGGNTITLPAGANGSDGRDGATWLTGTGAPDNANGNNGDLYLDTDSGDYYIKADGTWGNSVGNLMGPQGVTGPAGAPGESGNAYFSENANGDIALSSAKLGLGKPIPTVQLDVVGDANIVGQLTVDGSLVLKEHQGDIPAITY